MDTHDNTLFEYGGEIFDLDNREDAIKALWATYGCVANKLPKELIENDADVNIMILLSSGFNQFNYINEGLKNYFHVNNKRYYFDAKNEKLKAAKTDEERQKVLDEFDKDNFYTVFLNNCLSKMVDDYFAQKNKKPNQPGNDDN